MLKDIAGLDGLVNKATPLSPVMFDPQRRAGSPAMRAAVDALVAHLEQREVDLKARKRARRDMDRESFRLAVEAIACNLAWLILAAPDRFLAVPRSSGVMWATGRYGNPVYGQHFLDVLDLMALPEVGLIETPTMGYRFASGGKGRSTITPTSAFRAYLPLSATNLDCLVREPEPEVLILKGPKDPKTGQAEWIDYPDTRETRRRRKEVQRINTFLRGAPIRIVGDEGMIGLVDNDDQPIDPTRRSLRRIFNNGRWLDGGRFFDGFWENMKRADRFKSLRIGSATHPEGERIANVDFGQLFPTLAYHWIGRSPPDGDLYDVVGGGIRREGFKRLINALLFAEDRLTRWPTETSRHFPKGTKLGDTLAVIRNFHAPISRLFGTGIGFRLMLIESEVLIQALTDLFARSVTALPLHDSVLVARSQAEVARDAMAAAFAVFTNEARGKLKVDYGDEYQ